MIFDHFAVPEVGSRNNLRLFVIMKYSQQLHSNVQTRKIKKKSGFFRGLWVRSIYHQYPKCAHKCAHGMVGTVGRGGDYFPLPIHPLKTKSKRCCHNLQSNPFGIYQRIAPLQTRTIRIKEKHCG